MGGKTWIAIIGILTIITITVLWGFVSWPAFTVATVEQEEVAPITLLDDLGRNVTVEKPPERIISMAPSVTEILFAVGLGDRVVGVTNADDYPPEVEKIERIGDAFGWSFEKIVDLKPDLIVMDRFLDLRGEALAKLEGLRLKVLVLYARSVDDMLRNIQLVGKATGTEENATQLVSSLQQRMDAIVEKTKMLPKENMPRVFYTFWYDGTGDPWTAGFNTFADDLIRKAGGINVVGIRGGFFQVGLEVVVWANPQIIIIGETPKYPSPTPDAIRNEARLKDTEALKNGGVHIISSDLVDRPGPRLVDGLEELARLLHPELFP